MKSNFAGQVIGNRFQIFSGAIEAVVTTGLLWFGAGLVIQGELTPRQLVAFNMLLGNVIRPFQRLTVLWNQVQEVVIAIERIHDVIETEPEEDLQQQSRQTLPPIKGHIRFDKVTLLKKCKRYKHASTSLYTNSSPKKGGVELVNKLCLQVATKSNTTIKNVQLGRYAAKPL